MKTQKIKGQSIATEVIAGKPQWLVDCDGKPYVLVPRHLFTRERALIDDTINKIMADEGLENYDPNEVRPIELIEKIIGGEHPIKVYREWRNLTQEELRAKIGVASGYISQLEKGHKSGSIELIKKIATALDIDFEDLID